MWHDNKYKLFQGCSLVVQKLEEKRKLAILTSSYSYQAEPEKVEENKTFKMGNDPGQMSDCGTFPNFFHKVCKSAIAALPSLSQPCDLHHRFVWPSGCIKQETM